MQARRQAVKQLEQELANNQSSIQALSASERELEQLIASLQNVLGDIPDDLAAAQAFGALKGKLERPVRGRILARFGQRGLSGQNSRGLWWAASAGESVKAPAAGRVAFAEWLSGYGLMLILDHGDGYMSIFAHNDALLVELGDWVSPGQTITRAGSSGGLSRTALYIEIRKNGKAINPNGWFK